MKYWVVPTFCGQENTSFDLDLCKPGVTNTRSGHNPRTQALAFPIELGPCSLVLGSTGGVRDLVDGVRSLLLDIGCSGCRLISGIVDIAGGAVDRVADALSDVVRGVPASKLCE